MNDDQKDIKLKEDIVNDMKKSLSFMKISVITMFVIAIVFTIVMIVIFIVMGQVPDTLITSVFGFISVEGGAMAIIKSIENYTKKMTEVKKIEVGHTTIGDIINDVIHEPDDTETDMDNV